MTKPTSDTLAEALAEAKAVAEAEEFQRQVEISIAKLEAEQRRLVQLPVSAQLARLFEEVQLTRDELEFINSKLYEGIVMFVKLALVHVKLRAGVNQGNRRDEILEIEGLLKRFTHQDDE